MKTDIFKMLMVIAEQVGNVNCANMYSENFMNLEGTTADGRDFHVCLSIQGKEEKKDGN